MTIDERIEALTGRVEAIANSVELMSQMMQDHEKKAEARMERTHREVQRLARYARIIALSHETRLEDLEGLDEDEDGGGRK